MRKLTSLLFIALLAVASVGCDSNDDPTDAEQLVGRWALTGASDAEGDQSVAFATNFSSVILNNLADNSFTITVTPRDNPATAGVDESQFVQTIPGTYSVTESTNRITLTAETDIGQANLVFTYAFVDDDTVTLTTDSTTALLLNSLFSTTLVPPAVITVTRQ